MTPEERAEKISNNVVTFAYASDVNEAVAKIQKFVVSEIRAAVEEARKAPNYLPCKHPSGNWCWPCVQQAEGEAKAEAYEEAAKIAESAPLQPGAVIHVEKIRRSEPYVTGPEWAEHIAKRIRARAKEIQ